MPPLLRSLLLVAALLPLACSTRPQGTGVDAGADAAEDAAIEASSDASDAPDASDASASASASVDLPPQAPPPMVCPKAMLAVAGKFCVDKWEASLIDKKSRAAVSPYYPPDRRLAAQIADTWEKDRLTIGDEKAQHTAIPALPAWQRERDPDPVALSRPGVKPNGYLTQIIASRACANAGKRLCTPIEWRSACEGEKKRAFPYGEVYEHGACNIFRALHPAVTLHGNAAVGHLDPRLNTVQEKNGDPLLRATGTTSRCKIEWDGDAAWDMNGNIDEWVDDGPELGADPSAAASASSAASAEAAPSASASAKPIPLQTGRFLGGFFSRSKRDGCASSIGKHLKSYFDYSTGTRCCWSPEPVKAGMLPDPPPAD
ncbi:MAG: hypothetical protein ABI193_20835 [Minicystis sp.]